MGLLAERNAEAKRGREGMPELGGGPFEEGVEGRELGATNRQARRPLPDRDFDVGEAGLVEDGALDVVGNGPGLLEGDSRGSTPMVTRSGQNGYSSLALAQPKPMTAVYRVPRPLRYASAFLRISGQEEVMGWS